MHLILIRFRLARSGQPPREELAVARGCPFEVVKAWQAEANQRAAELGEEEPSVALASHRPVSDAEVEKLEQAGVVVHRFAGWDDQPVRVDEATVQAVEMASGEVAAAG